MLYHFLKEQSAWNFALAMIATNHFIITDYGVDKDGKYFVKLDVKKGDDIHEGTF